MNRRSALRLRSARPGLAVVGLVAAFTVVAVWGRRLDDANPSMLLAASPWFGHWGRLPLDHGQWRPLALAGVLAVVLVGWWPRWCRRAPIGWLPPTAGVAGVAWAVALQVTEGWSALARPLHDPNEALAVVDRVVQLGPLPFLDTFVDRLGAYPIHVQGHPPGQPVVLWLLAQVGLGGAGPAAALSLIGAGVATTGVLYVARWEAGDQVARQAAIFVGLAPAVITTATSTDPVFAALTVSAIALAFKAERASGRRALAWAIAAGLTAVASVYFTYGAPLFLLPALLPAWRLARRQQWTTLLAGASAAVGVVAAVSATGFLLWAGLAATTDAYHAGVASQRPYGYFVITNLVVLGVSVGPAAVAGAARGRAGRLLPVIALAATGAVVADLTGLSKAEVERIWLPLVPWLTLAAAPWGQDSGTARRWLGAQLAVAFAIQLILRGSW